MSSRNFLTGLGIGVITGATLAVVVAPPDKKKLMKSGVGRSVRAISEVVNGISGMMM